MASTDVSRTSKYPYVVCYEVRRDGQLIGEVSRGGARTWRAYRRDRRRRDGFRACGTYTSMAKAVRAVEAGRVLDRYE